MILELATTLAIATCTDVRYEPLFILTRDYKLVRPPFKMRHPRIYRCYQRASVCLKPIAYPAKLIALVIVADK